MALCQAPPSDSRTFFGLHLYVAPGRCFKNPIIARDSAQLKSGPGITCLVSVITTIPFFNNDSPPPRQFLRTKYFKKIARENAHRTNY